MTDIQLANFIKRLELELEDIGQDLDGLLLNISDCRIGDFGCEHGLKTLGLMLCRNVSECIGIDKFTGEDGSPSLKNVEQCFDNLKATVLAISEHPQEDYLIGKIRHLLRKERWPTFQQDNVLRPQNLPINLELAYCNKLLRNIYSGLYDNFPKNIEGVTLAINNMLGRVKRNGYICLVEEQTGSGIVDQVLKKAEDDGKLNYSDKYRTFSRQIIGEHGRLIEKLSMGVNFEKDDIIVFHARKL